MKKAKYIGIICVFFALIFGLLAAHLIVGDESISASERRKLAQLPKLDADTVFSGEFSTELEDYLLDQFPARDSFRTVKAALRFYLFRQSDNNGIYLVDGGVYKIEYPLKEAQVEYAGNKVAAVIDTYLQGMNVYYSVIPDKGSFVADEHGYPEMDYDRMLELYSGCLPDTATYIDITDVLSESCYYRTDSHWMQQRIYPVAERLIEGMGAHDAFTAESDYQEHTLTPFYGVYCGQSALPVSPDTIIYLTSEYTDAATVTGIELSGETPVYALERFSGLDGYDVFLSGAQSVITIDVPNAKTDRGLIIFRDSFASSLAPLFLGAYSSVTLVDLRYISSSLLSDYVDFTNQDVLFLYSASLLNSGMLLK